MAGIKDIPELQSVRKQPILLNISLIYPYPLIKGIEHLSFSCIKKVMREVCPFGK